MPEYVYKHGVQRHSDGKVIHEFHHVVSIIGLPFGLAVFGSDLDRFGFMSEQQNKEDSCRQILRLFHSKTVLPETLVSAFNI